MSAVQHYALAGGVVYEVVDDEAVVLHLPSGTYYRLNPVATRAWESLVRTGQLGSAIRDVVAEFEVSEGDLAADLDRLAAELVERSLLEPVVARS